MIVSDWNPVWHIIFSPNIFDMTPTYFEFREILIQGDTVESFPVWAAERPFTRKYALYTAQAPSMHVRDIDNLNEIPAIKRIDQITENWKKEGTLSDPDETELRALEIICLSEDALPYDAGLLEGIVILTKELALTDFESDLIEKKGMFGYASEVAKLAKWLEQWYTTQPEGTDFLECIYHYSKFLTSGAHTEKFTGFGDQFDYIIKEVA